MDIIVPPHVETSLTGFIGAAEQTIRNKRYRFEVWRYAPQQRCSIDGRAVQWEEFTNAGRRLAHRYAAFLASS